MPLPASSRNFKGITVTKWAMKDVKAAVAK
jgi:hypothetical protein